LKEKKWKSSDFFFSNIAVPKEKRLQPEQKGEENALRQKEKNRVKKGGNLLGKSLSFLKKGDLILKLSKTLPSPTREVFFS